MSVTAETQEIFMPSRHCLKNEMFLKEIIHNTSFIKNNPLISLRLATFVMFWIVAQSTSDEYNTVFNHLSLFSLYMKGNKHSGLHLVQEIC